MEAPIQKPGLAKPERLEALLAHPHAHEAQREPTKELRRSELLRVELPHVDGSTLGEELDLVASAVGRSARASLTEGDESRYRAAPYGDGP